jgi:polar amino acid transport system substrate-binding protein
MKLGMALISNGIALGLLLACASAKGMEISTTAQDSAPKYVQEPDGQISGLCIDIMRAIQSVDPKIQFTGSQKILPFKRIEQNLKTGQIDAFFGFSSSPQRVIDYEFVTIPLYPVKYIMAARRDDLLNITSLDDIRSLGKDGIVLTLFGTIDADYLRDQGGLQIDDQAYTVKSLLAKLDGKRGRFAYYHDLGLLHTMRKFNLEEKIRLLPPSFQESQHYVAFSKKADPAKFRAVQRALQRLRDSGALKAIYKRYSLE